MFAGEMYFWWIVLWSEVCPLWPSLHRDLLMPIPSWSAEKQTTAISHTLSVSHGKWELRRGPMIEILRIYQLYVTSSMQSVVFLSFQGFHKRRDGSFPNYYSWDKINIQLLIEKTNFLSTPRARGEWHFDDCRLSDSNISSPVLFQRINTFCPFPVGRQMLRNPFILFLICQWRALTTCRIP